MQQSVPSFIIPFTEDSSRKGGKGGKGTWMEKHPSIASSMAKVNNRVINYRDFSRLLRLIAFYIRFFFSRNNFKSMTQRKFYLSTFITLARKNFPRNNTDIIVSQRFLDEIEVWPELHFSHNAGQMEKKSRNSRAGNSNVDPATWPNKMEKENNGG